MTLQDKVRRTTPDVIAAMLVTGFGIGFAWVGAGYGIGTTARIGPGFVPLLTGFLLAGLGTGLVVEAIVSEPSCAVVAARPFAAVLGAVLLFALLIEPAGLVPATFALVACSSLADRRPGVVFLLLLTAALCLIGIVLFIYFLGLPLRSLQF